MKGRHLTIYEKLNLVFRTVFEDDDLLIGPDMTASDIEGWDSLSHVNLIFAVENAFAIRFGRRELLAFRNIGDLHESIEAKLKGL